MNASILLFGVALSMSSVPADEDRDIRVMSFNIRYGSANDGENSWDKRKDLLLETVRTFNPDLLGTQETLASQRDDLKAGLEGYGMLAAGRDDGRERGEMMALFYRESRFEKIDGGHFWLSETPDQVGSKSWDSSLPRMVTWVKLRDKNDPDASPIAYFNTHFDHRGPKARLESANLIRRKVDEIGEGCRIIVSGDFNASENSAPYNALFSKNDSASRVLIDTFRAVHPTKGANEGTFSGFRAAATSGPRIDWIAVSTDWTIQDATIDRTSREGHTPSDHFPITAVIRSTPAEKPDKVTLRVLSYNIHHGEGIDGKLDLERIADVIKSVKPDLVALQEVDRGIRRSGSVDQPAELAQLTGLYGTFRKAIDHDGGEYGQAILSRFPIAETIVHPLPGPPDREKRIAVEIRLMIEGQALSFVSTHFDHQINAIRERQADRINQLFGAVDRLAILAGDLNATPESKPLNILSQHWNVAAIEQSALTIPTTKPTRKIDYVLGRTADGFRVVEETVLDEAVASDHRPLLVVLERLQPESE